ncbi:DUF3153 domain-containing protein [Spirulina major]|uniref:DUF3153 domain-containing protein n=1 Tax=Spirulina major TaxID=270636 RepID=UPI0009350705|nr:DUF3153 domain-containing protein [Spirulina major]
MTRRKRSWLQQWRRVKRQVRSRLHYLLFLLLCSLLLSGCVRYDVGVNVVGQYQGTITQHIQLGEQLTNFSQREVQDWLKTLEQRAKALHGKAKRNSDTDLEITIPFSNGADLHRKFNQFFNPTQQTPEQLATDPSQDIIELSAGLGFTQSNFLLVERDRLRLEVDLRSLGGLNGETAFLLNANTLLNLQFSLTTPWGARAIAAEDSLVQRLGPQTIWQLQPGQLNYIEAVFWVPSFLGLGTVVIIALVVAGSGLKQRFFTPAIPPAPTVAD